MAFLRKDHDNKEMLVALMNMAGIAQTLTIGVPEDGKYEELLHTDNLLYGGEGHVTGDAVLEPARKECDGRPYMLTVDMPPLSVAVFRHTPYTEEENQIRVIRHESHDKMEKEQVKKRTSMEEALRREEEKLLKELRERYEKEISAQEKAIADKYHKQEEIKIQNILAGTSPHKVVRKKK